MLKTSPENTADIEALADMLRACSIDGTVSYAAMTDAIGRNIQHHRYLLVQAQNVVEAETGALFGTVRGEGVKRLPTSRYAEVGTHTIKRIRRAARKGMQRLSHVRANDLTEGDAQMIEMQRSHLGAIATVADHRKTKDLTEYRIPDSRSIPVGRVLEMFRK